MSTMSDVHVVLPNDIDDPAAPSGGNTYDRRLCRGLAALGWSVREHAVRGAWPRPRAGERAELARVLAALPPDAVVLLDGLVASAVPDVLVPLAHRLRLVVLVHLPLVDDAEGEVLRSAAAVVATSAWSRRRLLEAYPLAADRVHVAPPGVEAAPRAGGTAAGSTLLCVAAVTGPKGHDVLVEALATLRATSFTCACIGSLDRDPAFVEHLRARLRVHGLAGRVTLAGPRTGKHLGAVYAGADLLVLPSRGETYGMVVTEALARGIPVLATAVGGVPESMGRAADGDRPGLLVPPGDPAALAGALRRWLGEPALRERLRSAAADRATTLTGWDVTAQQVSSALI
jgi:glycosyltransferase involved in cell wall biosynthesis